MNPSSGRFLYGEKHIGGTLFHVDANIIRGEYSNHESLDNLLFETYLVNSSTQQDVIKICVHPILRSLANGTREYEFTLTYYVYQSLPGHDPDRLVHMTFLDMLSIFNGEILEYDGSFHFNVNLRTLFDYGRCFWYRNPPESNNHPILTDQYYNVDGLTMIQYMRQTNLIHRRKSGVVAGLLEKYASPTGKKINILNHESLEKESLDDYLDILRRDTTNPILILKLYQLVGLVPITVNWTLKKNTKKEQVLMIEFKRERKIQQLHRIGGIPISISYPGLLIEHYCSND